MCHGLAEARCDTIQDDVDEVMVHHLSIDIESIDIIQVFLDSTYLLEITNLVKSPICLIVVAMVVPNGVLDLLRRSTPVSMCFLPFQFFSFYA